MPDIIEVVASEPINGRYEEAKGIVINYYPFDVLFPPMPRLQLTEEEASDEEFEAYLLETGHDVIEEEDDDDVYSWGDGRPLE